MNETTRNRYLEHVQIDAPDIEALMEPREICGRRMDPPRPLQLLACAILEAGRPLKWDEAAARLGRAGLTPKSGSLDALLRRAWGGKRPVVKGPGDTLDLDLHAVELECIIQQLDLRPDPPELHVVGGTDEGDQEADPPEDERPLDMQELELAFGDADLDAINGARQAVAVLDAKGVDGMKASEVETLLASLTRGRASLSETTPRAWAAAATSLREDGVVVLDRSHRGLPAMRRLVRTWARAAGDLKREAKVIEARQKACLEDSLRAWHQQHGVYQDLRRSVLLAVPTPEAPVAAALLEFPPGGGDERVRVFPPGELDALRSALSEQDAIAGVDPRASLHALGVDPHRPYLVDLVPESWMPRAERGRRARRLTRTSLLRTATGHAALPRGAMAALLRRGDREAIEARLRLDVWALASLYRFGVLYRGLPLYEGKRPIFVDCNWGLPGEPMLPAILDQATREDREVEFRDRNSWRRPQPWARSRPGRIVGIGPGLLVLEGRRGRFELDTETIGDVRFKQPT